MTGPFAILAACLPPHLADVPEARAACLWLADVGSAVVATAHALRGMASAQ